MGAWSPTTRTEPTPPSLLPTSKTKAERQPLMAAGPPSSPSPFPASLLLILLLHTTCLIECASGNNLVFNVSRTSVSRSKRHGRMLDAYDAAVTGFGGMDGVGMYFLTLVIGDPPVPYNFMIDTNSEVMWLNGEGCSTCPNDTTNWFEIRHYSLQKGGRNVSREDDFCVGIYGDSKKSFADVGTECRFKVSYNDGSSSEGYFVRDVVQLHHLMDSFESNNISVPIVFGRATEVEESLQSTDGAVDGILGLGHDNASFIPQLAQSLGIKKIFSHCLDYYRNGSGIFAIGDVVMSTGGNASYSPSSVGYKLQLAEIYLGEGQPPLSWNGETKDAIWDVGTPGCVFPASIRSKLFSMVSHSLLNPVPQVVTENIYPCLVNYDASEESLSKLPNMTIKFDSGATLTVQPRDYMFTPPGENILCFNMDPSDTGSEETIILGGVFVANRVVVYDLEQSQIRWSEGNYDCYDHIMVSGNDSAPIIIYGPAQFKNHRSSESAAYHFEVGRSAFFLVLIAILFALVP